MESRFAGSDYLSGDVPDKPILAILGCGMYVALYADARRRVAC